MLKGKEHTFFSGVSTLREPQGDTFFESLTLRVPQGDKAKTNPAWLSPGWILSDYC